MMASFVGSWLLILRGHPEGLFLSCMMLGIASEMWGRSAMWERVPPRIRRILPKEPLDSKAMPSAAVRYRDLYRVWRQPSDPGGIA
jgi:hypothetical protein